MKNIIELKPFKHLIMTIGNLPSSYVESLSYYECLVWLCNYLEKTVIPSVNNNAEAVEELQEKYVELKNYVDNYFDNLDVQEEIDNKLDEMAESGELNEIISKYLNLPSANYCDALRIGRKINFGTSPNSSTHDESGVAANMQGGCYIGDNKVAYMLWDSLNTNLNKNTIVIMNINTGEILNTYNFTYGWCNSLAYNDGLIYVAVRGTTSGGVATNNGEIKVLNADTLVLENEFNLPINVNAISIYDDTIYALQENTNTIYLYELDGTSLNQTISLNVNLSNLYNQDLKVTENYIYVISTRPSNILNVYLNNGTHVKSYNLPKYGGLYKLGELQWLDTLNSDLLLGTNIANFEEFNNQFFKLNLSANVSTNKFNEDYTQTLYVNSDVNYYNPDGTTGNEFSTINECDCLNIDHIIARCNDKDYKYTYLKNHKTFRINHAILSEGLFIQSGKYMIENSTIDYSINTSISACVQLRDCDVVFSTVLFDANDNAYCINDERYSNIKFMSPSFTNYTTSVFSTNIPSSVVNLNTTDNVPYIPRTYGREYNLMCNGWINQFKAGTYAYVTDLNSTQIAELFTNCSRLIIGYEPLNTITVKELTVAKNTTNSIYNIVDSTTSTGSVNLRVCKCTATINENGVKITSNTTTTILSDSSSVTSAADSDTSDLFIKIRYIKLII